MQWLKRQHKEMSGREWERQRERYLRRRKALNVEYEQLRQINGQPRRPLTQS